MHVEVPSVQVEALTAKVNPVSAIDDPNGIAAHFKKIRQRNENKIAENEAQERAQQAQMQGAGAVNPASTQV